MLLLLRNCKVLCRQECNRIVLRVAKGGILCNGFMRGRECRQREKKKHVPAQQSGKFKIKFFRCLNR
jgi:hypothetical protein